MKLCALLNRFINNKVRCNFMQAKIVFFTDIFLQAVNDAINNKSLNFSIINQSIVFISKQNVNKVNKLI